ncbi:YueI family protein [Enterococcus sp. LJL120]
MADELQKHLDKGIYGAPLVNPDEQHKYLGTFRERCHLTMTLEEMPKKANQDNLLKEFALHPGSSLLLNGKVEQSVESIYIQLASKQNIRFTIVNDFVGDQPTDIGLVFAAKTAVNEEVVDVEAKYPLSSETSATEPEKKSGFWHNLFK